VKPTIGEALIAATCRTPRLTRLAILAITAATALSVASCRPSNKENREKAAPSASPSSSSAPAKGKEQVAGLIASVSGSTIQVIQQISTATVDFTPSTNVNEVTSAQLTDVTAGSCVNVQSTRESARTTGPITAQSVHISPAVDGKCRQPNGTVASVTGNSIAVTDAGGSPSQSTVTVTDTTKYTKQAAADAQAITQGKCITARGTTDGGGALQATTITVRPASNGHCPQSGERHHGRL
jgi:hypothetical protein